MTTSTFGDIVSRGLNWLLTGGVRVILILGAIFLGLFLLRRALTKLQNFLEGALPDTAKVKRARTLTHVLGDMVRLPWVGPSLENLNCFFSMNPFPTSMRVCGLPCGLS